MRTKADLIKQLESYRLSHTSAHGRTQPERSEKLMTAWIFHDNHLEGRSFNPAEVQAALRREDERHPSYVRPKLEDARAYERAIEMVCEWSVEGQEGLTLSRLKELHKQLMQYEPKEGARLRLNSPVHRDYHQEICAHTQVPRLLTELYQEAQRFDPATQDILSYAAYLHHRLMHIYPFRRMPGALARLFTNHFLMAHGYPPVILPAHERGEYYDALSSYDHQALSKMLYRAAWRMLEILPAGCAARAERARAAS
jgi:Fic family protein